MSQVHKKIVNQTIVEVTNIERAACEEAMVVRACEMSGIAVDDPSIATSRVEWSTDRDGDFQGVSLVSITLDHELGDANRKRDLQRQPRLDELSNEPNPIRKLCGYVENGSGVTVKVFQDDATRDWFVIVDKRKYFDKTFNGAVAKAMLYYKAP